MADVRRRWGDTMLVSCRVKLKCLEWLGHLARMSDTRLPKCVFFGWLPQPRPRCGPRKRWKDVIKKDLVNIVSEDNWYETARSRTVWRSKCIDSVKDEVMCVHRPPVNQLVLCEVCNRTFSCERRKPISEQKGAVQCPRCFKWFKSMGGRAIHICVPRH